MKTQKIETTWQLVTYDVWGNAKDGYEVNQAFTNGTQDLQLIPETCNAGTPNEFVCAYPTDKQLKRALGIRCHIETDGDDVTIYINRKRDGYPICELRCLSHESLSPIRAKA